MAIHDGLPAGLCWVPVVNVKVLVLFVANLVLTSRTGRPSGRSEALTARDVPVLEPRAGLE
jgi:hypothetical protein